MVKAWLRPAFVVAWLGLLLGTFACAEQHYVVQPGDTLTGVARRFDTTVPALAAANRLPDDLLRVGQVLVVPGGQAIGYRITVVEPGETLADVAKRVGRSSATLASANPGLTSSGLEPGAVVSVPPADGVTVEVAPGDNLATLAARVGLSASALAKLNQLPANATLQPGQSLLLPADAPIQAGAGGAAGPTGPTEPEPADRGAAGVGVRRAASRPPVEAALSARQRLRGMQDDGLRAAVALLPKVSFTTGTFMAPVQGRVSSRFGWRALSVNGNHYHAGVDLAAPMGTPVHAARDGVVVKAGWGGTYGNVVFLDHGDGTQTRYAHLSRIDVRVGEGVRQGDVLGLVGSTGASTGPHVHFELRFDGRAVDPLAYLHGLATR